ncbi:LCP family protein [Nocardioides flavescens]|uniref:LytR family transcriptional regulator n=1 Tax=Nocardioides flavescens TaxID=2691959 RepID=A0A6L7EV56_9ACTN|nr:LCP family protein [Nocardioides flavescens]MXG89576.1 LytR family transcriptional regulator [Nocardioides flavescens]
MPSPQVPSPSPQQPADRRTTTADRAAKVRFRRALALMAMTLLLPGSAQVAYGNKRVGRIALRVWVGLLLVSLVSLVLSTVHHEFAFWLVSDLTALQAVRLVLMALAIAWAALLVDAWRLGQPLSLSMSHRRAAVGVNGILCFSVAATLLFGAHLVGVQRTFIQTMFGSGDVTGAHDGRYNVLLLGGDSGIDRWGLRPDSITVASIDARTGQSTLISLPRNMQNFPFRAGSVMDKQFPKGFDCEHCMLNGVNTWAGDHLELFEDKKNAGIDATISAVEGITGLKVNYWAMVNLKGFRDLVDAVGGVKINVRSRIPIGGLGSDVYDYIEPGTQTLTGFQTQWYARARDGSDDYSRMARQKCIMGAMLDQLDPTVVLRNFQKIAKASSAMVSTSIPAGEVDRFIALAIKAKGQKIGTLSLVPPLVDTYQPDIALIQAKVAEAVGAPVPQTAQAAPAASDSPAASSASSASSEPTKAAKPKKPKPAADEPVTGGSLGSLKDGYVANQTEDLGAAC